METKAAPSAEQASAWKYLLQFLCNWPSSILDDKMGNLLKYGQLLKNPKYKDMRSQSFSKENCQIVTTTETIAFHPKPEIPQVGRIDIPYSRIVCTYGSQKKDPY
jgi:hypothetical protein